MLIKNKVMNKRIYFSNIEWEKPSVGVKQKIYIKGNKRLRLLKFKDNFIEKEWCLNGHIGHVIGGEMKIDYNGQIQLYKKGDGIWISKGEQSKHKVIIEKGKKSSLCYLNQ